MDIKLLEIRDRGTCIAAIAFKIDSSKNESERFLMGKAGFGLSSYDQNQYIFLTALQCHKPITTDPYEWGDRTYKAVHLHLIDSWDDITSGDVIDVEYILKESDVKKLSENLTTGHI